MRAQSILCIALLSGACSEAEPSTETDTSPVAVDHSEELAAMRQTIMDLQARVDELEGAQDTDTPAPPPPAEPEVTQEDLDALAARVDMVEQSIPEPTDTSGLSDSIAGLDAELEGVDSKADGLDMKVGTVDGRVTELDGVVDGVAQSVGALDTKVDGIGDDLEDVQGRVDGVNADLSGLGDDLDNVEAALPNIIYAELPCTEQFAEWREDVVGGGWADIRSSQWVAHLEIPSAISSVRTAEAWVCDRGDVAQEGCGLTDEQCSTSPGWLPMAGGCQGTVVKLFGDRVSALCGSSQSSTTYSPSGAVILDNPGLRWTGTAHLTVVLNRAHQEEE